MARDLSPASVLNGLEALLDWCDRDPTILSKEVMNDLEEGWGVNISFRSADGSLKWLFATPPARSRRETMEEYRERTVDIAISRRTRLKEPKGARAHR